MGRKINGNKIAKKECGAPILTEGAQFFVTIWEDKVFKIPKRDMTQSQLKKLAEIQSYLSQYFEEIPYIEYANGVLVEDKAQGIELDELMQSKKISREKYQQIKQRVVNIKEKIKEYGYLLRDTNDHNIFFDEKRNKIYIIDFFDIRRLEKKGEEKPKLRAWQE